MTRPIKKLLLWIAVIIFVIIVGRMLWNQMQELKGIKDTNGAEDFTLQTITDENIIKQDLGMKGGLHVRNSSLGNDVIISADRFTGVYEILNTNTIGISDFAISFSEFSVRSGNFKAVVVSNGKIVKVIEFTNDDVSLNCIVNDLNGDVRLVIAGEEADFTIRIPLREYNRYSHPKN